MRRGENEVEGREREYLSKIKIRTGAEPRGNSPCTLRVGLSVSLRKMILFRGMIYSIQPRAKVYLEEPSPRCLQKATKITLNYIPVNEGKCLHFFYFLFILYPDLLVLAKNVY